MKIRKGGKKEYGKNKQTFGKENKKLKNEVFEKFNQKNNVEKK